METKEINYFLIILLVIVVLFVLLSSSTAKASTNGTTTTPSGTNYVAGGTYVHPVTGKEIRCYDKGPFPTCDPTISKSDSEGGAIGTLYSSTNKVCCYLFN